MSSTKLKAKPTRLIVAENLKRILDSRGRGARKELAEAVGVVPSQISDYCSGRENIGLNTLDILAAALNVDPLELITEF